MSLAAVFDQLGQSVMPMVTAAVFPDTMTVYGETTLSDSGGGRVKSAVEEVYIEVPCTYEAMQTENRLNSADKLLSIQQYMMTFPTHNGNQIRYDIDPKVHRFVVDARGNEPEQTFRIVALRNVSGVIFEAVCTKEN